MAKIRLINGIKYRRAYRRSDTGRFCKKEFADQNPSMTQGHWIRMSSGRPKKKKK